MHYGFIFMYKYSACIDIDSTRYVMMSRSLLAVVLGCADLPPTEDVWYTRIDNQQTNDNATFHQQMIVHCNHSNVSYRLTCKGNVWIGPKIWNCANNLSAETGRSLSVILLGRWKSIFHINTITHCWTCLSKVAHSLGKYTQLNIVD